MTHQLDLTLLNQAGELPRIQDRFERFAERHGCSGFGLHQAQLALEEHLTNIICYAHDDQAEHEIQVRIRVDEENLTVEIEDDGRPFNPLDFPAPDVAVPIDRRPIGGLGILMLRKSMDRVEYRRERGRNILLMSKRFSGTETR